MKQTTDIRGDALAQLKQAQQMIKEGRKELAAATEKIRVAQKLIDQSADALRTAPANRLHVGRPR
jgi:exonuclease VII small subunit